jgi:hypothetical protein
MKRLTVALVVLAGFLAGCAGPVQVAKTESEGIKTNYQDPALTQLQQKNQALAKDIFARYQRVHMGIAKEGIGFTSLVDTKGKKLYYLLVEIRPEEVNFNQHATTGTQRLQTIMQRYFEPNLRMMTKQDVGAAGIDGLAFGVTWAVRDYYQCDKYGGFVEYVIAYMSKADFNAIVDGSKTVGNVLRDSEVITSLDLAPAQSIRLTYQ